MTTQEFDEFCRIARAYKVMAFKVGTVAVQFEITPLSEEPAGLRPGDWKRDHDLAYDPDLDKLESLPEATRKAIEVLKTADK